MVVCRGRCAIIFFLHILGIKIMKYTLLIAAAFLVLFLVGCGEPKPGQYPPSQNILDDRD